MPCFRPLSALLLLSFTGLLIGCGASATTNVDVSSDDDKFLDELLGDLDSGTDPPMPIGSEQVEAEPAPGFAIPAPPVAKADPGKQLQLRLQTGDRFPLVKTIRQNLVQTSAEAPASAQSQLELHMVIQVDDMNAQAILMNVKYTRIMYSHDLNGQSLAYDSDTHQNAVPADILPYAGMVNNGFAFWLGRDNKIQQLVGYQEFLQKCVERVPAERRQTLLAEISARFGDDGVANFVDDTLGLLPYDQTVNADAATRVAVGDVWYRERRLMHPTPVYMKSTCRLLSLNEETAEIDITGRIASGDTYQATSSGQTKVQVRDGRSMGSCVIDRETGLPLKVSRSRYLNMTVTDAAGQSFEQQKRIETTIQTFPNTRGPVANRALPSAGNISMTPSTASSGQLVPTQQEQVRPMPGGGFTPSRFGVRQTNGQRPVHSNQPIQQATGTLPRQPELDISGLQSEVRAVYPD